MFQDSFVFIVFSTPIVDTTGARRPTCYCHLLRRCAHVRRGRHRAGASSRPKRMEELQRHLREASGSLERLSLVKLGRPGCDARRDRVQQLEGAPLEDGWTDHLEG